MISVSAGDIRNEAVLKTVMLVSISSLLISVFILIARDVLLTSERQHLIIQPMPHHLVQSF